MKKDELQYLALLCKSEFDSLGRIAAGVLRILKLDGSLGSAAISQLSNLGENQFKMLNDNLYFQRLKQYICIYLQLMDTYIFCFLIAVCCNLQELEV